VITVLLLNVVQMLRTFTTIGLYCNDNCNVKIMCWELLRKSYSYMDVCDIFCCDVFICTQAMTIQK